MLCLLDARLLDVICEILTPSSYQNIQLTCSSDGMDVNGPLTQFDMKRLQALRGIFCATRVPAKHEQSSIFPECLYIPLSSSILSAAWGFY
jgi:hypothetical protein